MKIVIGIAVLVVCAIGAVSMLSWLLKQTAKLFKPYDNRTLLRVGRSEEYFDKKLTKFSDLPHYRGETGMFGLPRYRDVMVPNKHNYATVVYMNHPVKQYVYDLMATWKKLINPSRDNKYGLLAIIAFLSLPFLYNKWLGVNILVAFAMLVLILGPRGKRAVRCSAENAKDFTSDTWREIYRDVAASIERDDEIGRTYGKSGALKHWHGDRNWAGKRW